MNKLHTEILLHDFPGLYRDAKVAEGEPRSCMSWGFSCGDGWYKLIYSLSWNIEAEARSRGLKPSDEAWPMARQVKEKFGTLSFYVANSNEAIMKLINEASNQSAHTCQQCGLAGVLRRGGYWHVSCDSCEEKNNE